MPVKRSCHWLELEVGRPGALLRFQYVLPSDAHALEGVAALAAGTLPGDYARRGLLTLEALDRKVLLANLPVLAGGAAPRPRSLLPRVRSSRRRADAQRQLPG